MRNRIAGGIVALWCGAVVVRWFVHGIPPGDPAEVMGENGGVIVAAAMFIVGAYYLVKGEYPVHRFFHSFLGAAAAGLLAVVLFLVVVHASFIGFPRVIAPLTATSTARGEISVLGILLGGLVGGLSHPLLDGIMHPDVRPFMPWTDYNPFLGLIGLAPLHLACIVSTVLGAAGVQLWKRRSKGRST